MGIVDRVGQNVTKFKPGDRVVSSFQIGPSPLFVFWKRRRLLSIILSMRKVRILPTETDLVL